MPLIVMSTMTTAPPDEVWSLLGDFGALAEWHPAVVACGLSVGDDGTPIRTVCTVDGGQHRSQLRRHSDQERTYD